MSKALKLSPVDNNYLTSKIRYEQLLENYSVLDINITNFTVNQNAIARTYGDGIVYLFGSVVVAGTPTVNYEIATLPKWCVPIQDGYYPATVIRAGVPVLNAIKVNTAGDSIETVTVTAQGSYDTIPTITAGNPGTGAVLMPAMKAVSAILSTAGSGYAIGDTITWTGGTFSTATVATIATAEVASAVVNATGTGYAPADTVTVSGGTASTAAILAVTNTKVVSAAVNAAGTGYAPGNTIIAAGGTFMPAAEFTVNTTKVVSAIVKTAGSGGTDGTQTVTGTTGTGTKFQASVLITGGVITSVASITVNGSYTANPTDIINEPVTGAGLTGAVLTVVMGVATITISSSGVYSANSATLTQGSTSGSGTGATFNTVLYGVNAVSVSNAGVYSLTSATFTQASTSGTGTGATFNTVLYGVKAVTITTFGSYSALPSNPISQGSTSGSGTGAAFTGLWGLSSIAVTNPGSGYTSASTITVSGGGGTGGGAATFTLDSGYNIQLVASANVGDIVYLSNVGFPVNSYVSE